MKKLYILFVFLHLIFSITISQNKVWVSAQGGNAMFYNTGNMSWEPIINKQQISTKTFILTSGVAQFKAYIETNMYSAPNNAYFFLSDLFPKNKMQVVEELTVIESQQLRNASHGDSINHKNTVGLTYGNPLSTKLPDPGITISYFKERANAINWFYDQGRFDAALLSLKRLIVQYPSLYYNIKYTEYLLKLYEKYELYGFIYTETNWLLQIKKEDEFNSSMRFWNDLAKQKLTRR